MSATEEPLILCHMGRVCGTSQSGVSRVFLYDDYVVHFTQTVWKFPKTSSDGSRERGSHE